MSGEPDNGAIDIIRFDYPESAGAAFVPAWEGWDEPGAAVAVDETGLLDPTSTGSGAWNGGAEKPEDTDSPNAQSSPHDSAPDIARLMDEERERAFEAGFETGRRKGIEETREAARSAEAQARAQFEEQLEKQRIAKVTAALESFAGDRDQYLKTVEREVVKLALAVAARVLRREAEVDPLLLSGAVRVALGQIAASTEVRLRVPADELAMWKEAMAAVPNLAARPVVVAGEGMQLGDCAIESALGTADLGIGAQLAEVERVLQKEPAAARASVNTASKQEKRFRESAA